MTFQSFAAEGYSFPWGLEQYHARPMPSDLITRSEWSRAKGLPRCAASERMLRNARRVPAPIPYKIFPNTGKDLYSSAELDAWWAQADESLRLRRIELGQMSAKNKRKK